MADLEKLAVPADQFLYSDCPVYDGTYLGTFETKTAKKMVKVSLRKSGSFQEEAIPAKNLANYVSFDIGAPVSICLLEREERNTIISLEPRASGKDFDCLEVVYGILKVRDTERERSGLYISNTEFTFISHKNFPSAAPLPIGSALIIKVTRHKGRMRAHSVEVTPLRETSHIKRFSGEIRVHQKGFGFLDDVFVPPPVVGSTSSGEECAVLAVLEENTKKGGLSWTAISLEAIGTD